MFRRHQNLGRIGEEIARKYLQKIGYSILASNFRTRTGEIDLIAEKKGVLIFVEVKTRKSKFLDSPFEAVTVQKQLKISKVAQEYLAKYNLFEREARFDIISITMDNNGHPNIDHLENGFELSYGV